MKKLFTFILLITLGSMNAKMPFDFSNIQRYISRITLDEILDIKVKHSNKGQKLTTLDLSHKKTKKLPSNLSAQLKPVVNDKKHPVQVINHSNNNIKGELKEGTFDGLSKVTHIILNNNKITGVEPGAFNDLPSLQWIYLSNNKISGLKTGAFDNLTGLWGLVLSGNAISKFGPTVLEELRLLYELDLSHNKIKMLITGMFAAADAARKVTADIVVDGKDLKVDGEKITQRETRISNLQVINFQGNPIKKVEPDVFAGLPYLKQVVVSDDLPANVMKALQESVKMVKDSLQKYLPAKDKCRLVIVPNGSKKK